MASPLKKNIKAFRQARGISHSDLLERIGFTKAALDAELEREAPHEKFVSALSKELLVPDFMLFMEHPEINNIALVDFRSDVPAPSSYSRDTLKAINLARLIQSEADSLGTYQDEPKLDDLTERVTSVKGAAEDLRTRLNLPIELQLQATDARVFYNELRRKIEGLDVFILQASFGDGAGFCLTSRNTYDVIVINTLNQSYSRRLFTLSHELYHCLINSSGLSDPDVTRNATERTCNNFAAEFLAPKALVSAAADGRIRTRTLDIDQLRSFAQASKLSLHASLIRLIETDWYDRSAYAQWQAFLDQNPHPDFTSRRGGRRVDEWKYKLARYGTKFADVFGSACEADKTDALRIYRFSGLKPKYQPSYFQNAPIASARDAEDE